MFPILQTPCLSTFHLLSAVIGNQTIDAWFFVCLDILGEILGKDLYGGEALPRASKSYPLNILILIGMVPLHIPRTKIAAIWYLKDKPKIVGYRALLVTRKISSLCIICFFFSAKISQHYLVLRFLCYSLRFFFSFFVSSILECPVTTKLHSLWLAPLPMAYYRKYPAGARILLLHN